MSRLTFLVLALLLAACTTSPPPALSTTPGPDDPAAPAAQAPYRPVLAGTAYHDIGGRP
jgi:hypothetical protein